LVDPIRPVGAPAIARRNHRNPEQNRPASRSPDE
ncbi:MAG: hypothetical protein ACI9YT_000290, partial [Halobacteriales archaeon]